MKAHFVDTSGARHVIPMERTEYGWILETPGAGTLEFFSNDDDSRRLEFIAREPNEILAELTFIPTDGQLESSRAEPEIIPLPKVTWRRFNTAAPTLDLEAADAEKVVGRLLAGEETLEEIPWTDRISPSP